MLAGAEKYADLHEDDTLAFAQLATQYKADLMAEIDHLDRNDDIGQHLMEYMRKVLAAAEALGIENFASWRFPDRTNVHDDYDVFEFEVRKFVTAAEIRSARSVKVYSVELDAAAKTEIHFFISRIRDVVEKSDLDQRKKNSLFKKLNAFASDVDKSRTGFDNAYLVGIELAHLTKEFASSFKPATDFFRSISELLGAAKSKEPEAAQLPPPSKRIEAPQKRIEGPKEDTKAPFGDLDDDIPF